MKRIFIIPIILVVLVGGLVVAPNFVDWNSYKAQALTQAKTMTGLDVQINGDISMALLPSPRLYLEDVVVQDPTGADQPMLALKLLDVRVALAPLLSGQVVVNSFNLNNPQVRLTKNAEGRFNYQTPEIDALMGQKPADEGHKQAVAVSFDAVSIEKGQFYYNDAAAKAPLEIADLDLSVKVPSLQGPFDAEGAMIYGGQPLKFSAKTGELDAETHSTSLNATAEYAGANVKYAGVVTGGDVPSIQGEVHLSVSSMGDFMSTLGMQPNAYLSGPLEAEGVLSADKARGDLKNATIKIAGQTLEGKIAAGLEPLSVDGYFSAREAVDLDKMAAAGGTPKEPKAGGDITDLAAALPKTLELPVTGPIKMEIHLPSAVLNKQVLKDVTLALNKTDKGFKIDLAAAEIPGGGAVKGDASLEYAEKSKSQKTNTEIYTGPKAGFTLKGKSANAPATVQAFTGLKDLPMVKDSKAALFNIAGAVDQSGLIINEGVLNLDDKAFAISGSMKKQKDSPRSLLNIKVVADQLNFDEFMASDKKDAKQTQSSGDPLAPLKTLALPFDLTTDMTVNNATLQGYQIEGLRAALSVLPNSLLLQDVGARNFVDSSLSIKGKVGDLKNLGGLDITASLNTPDPYKLADALKMDTKAWPKNLGAVKANVKALGDINAVNVSADIGALGGNLIFKGNVATPTTTPGLSNVALQVKHPNMAQALKNFGMAAPDYKSFSGPVDLYTKVDMAGKVTTLNDIKATIAGTSMVGNLKHDATGSIPSVAGQLKFGKLVLQSANTGGVKSTASGAAEVRPTGSGGKWSSTPIDTAFLHSMNANFDISADQIIYETWDMKSPSLKMTLQGGTMNISDLKAGLFDGQVAMQGSVGSSAKDKPVNLQFNSKITNINMGALAKALSGTSRIEAEGDVSLNFDVAGGGRSQSDIVNSLKGKADLTGRNVVMKGFDLAALATAMMDSSKPLDRLQEVVGASTSGGQTAFETVDGAYAITNGVVNITSMKMDGSAASIVSTGNASLPTWYMDTVHTVTLKNAREVQPFKVTIRGPLDNPTNTFGKGMFESLLREKVKDQVIEKLPGLLGDKTTSKLQQFGILPTKQPAVPTGPGATPTITPATEPAAGDAVSDTAPTSIVPAESAPETAPVEPAPAAPKTKEEQAEEAVKGLINGLLKN